ncbi:MAG TPA: integrase domain-containing protein [Noviherbaspirillum sp.]|nr:integrase domain-containing protein [Noviherbaspirillum sp.]
MNIKFHSMMAIWMMVWTLGGKGGRGTRERAHCTFAALEQTAKDGRWGVVSPGKITLRQLRNYVQKRLESGIGVRTLESDLSAIRKAMRAAGRGIDAANFTREQLGLPPATRKGKGIAIPDEALDEAINKAPPRIRACIRVIEVLGLRMNELVESRDSLPDWERALSVGGATVELVAGAKGGKARPIFILPARRADAYLAVLELLSLTNGGKEHPIVARSGRAAYNKFGRMLRRYGIVLKHSCHSLRRRFALLQYRGYLLLGFAPRVALARLAMDLGHGEKRGRWVLNNYLINSLTSEELAAFPRRGRPRKDQNLAKKE